MIEPPVRVNVHVKERIFEPLDMRDTSWAASAPRVLQHALPR